jgi:hypothetical protein
LLAISVGLVAGAPQRSTDLRAIDLDVGRIEARRGERQPQIVERLVAIFRQRAQRAADVSRSA